MFPTRFQHAQAAFQGVVLHQHILIRRLLLMIEEARIVAVKRYRHRAKIIVQDVQAQGPLQLL